MERRTALFGLCPGFRASSGSGLGWTTLWQLSLATRAPLLGMLLLTLGEQASAEGMLDVRHPILERSDHPLLKRYPYLPLMCGWRVESASAAWVHEQAEECYRQWLDPTYPEDAKAARNAAKALSRECYVAIVQRNFEKAHALLDSIRGGLMRHHRVDVTETMVVLGSDQQKVILEAQTKGVLSSALAATNFDSLFSSAEAAGLDFTEFHLHQEEKQLLSTLRQARALWALLFFREKEREQEVALWRPESTFERLVEVASIFVFLSPIHKGMTLRFGLSPYSVRFLKDLETEGKRIALKIRTNDCYAVDRKSRTISLAHPRDSLRKFKVLLETVFEGSGFGAPIPYCFEGRLPSQLPEGGFGALGGCRQFDDIEEVVVTLYFDGKQSGTETVVAQFGLKREKYDRKKWRRLKANDGTIQDYLKVHGIYWLHPKMPDMGTPAHLLK